MLEKKHERRIESAGGGGCGIIFKRPNSQGLTEKASCEYKPG